jgi:nucleotide-binding universal stress UspA family protein
VTGAITCGVDASESATTAARVARALSARLALRLAFVRVVDDGTDEGKIAASAARLHQMAGEAPEVDGGARWRVDVGHPADRLVAAAEQENAALIVVGSTGSQSSLLGSISAEVSRPAPCPVVVVSPGAERPLDTGIPAAESNGGPSSRRREVVSGSIRLGSTVGGRERTPTRMPPAASSASTSATGERPRTPAERSDRPLGERRRSRPA